jgi:hypothetical protein
VAVRVLDDLHHTCDKGIASGGLAFRSTFPQPVGVADLVRKARTATSSVTTKTLVYFTIL